MAKRPKEHTGATQPTKIKFGYIKSNLFRVIHADGAIGGLTPSGNVHISFYSERSAIPKTMFHTRNEDGSLGSPIPEETIVRDEIIREMDIDVVLSPAAVDGLIKWLTDRRADLAVHRDTISQPKASAKKTLGKKQ